LKIIEMPRKDLIIDKMNVRGEWISDEELTESIKAQGIIEPLIIRKKDGKFGIVCGFRRFHAGLEAGLKTFPCVQRDLTDLDAKALSLQENLQRNNLDRVEEAEAIADLWEMMNDERSYEEKTKEMKKRFGLKQTSIHEYLAISRLSDKIKKFLKPTSAGRSKLDRTSAANISTFEDWEELEKEEAAEILSEIESPERRRKVLSEMKSYKDLSPKEAYEKVKRIPEGRAYSIHFEPRIVKCFDEACVKEKKDYKTLIVEIVESWLKRRKYLK